MENSNNEVMYQYQVGIYVKKKYGEGERKVSSHSYMKSSKKCRDEVEKDANEFFTGDNICRVDGVIIRDKKFDRVIDYLDKGEW